MLLLPAVFLLLLAPAAAAIAATATQDLVPFTNVTSINVCTREHTPFVACDGRSTPAEYTGYDIALFDEVRASLGWRDSMLNWTCFTNSTALVQALANGTCDMAVAALPVTEALLAKNITFTWPTFSEGLAIAVPVGNPSSDMWSFLDSFSPAVWLATIFTCFLAGIVIWALDLWSRVGEESEDIDEWERLKILTYTTVGRPMGARDAECDSFGGNIVMIVLCFILLVLVAIYTANTAANITTFRLSSSIASLSDLQNGNKVVGTWTGYQAELARRGVKTLGLPWNTAADERAMFQALSNGTLQALVLDRATAEYVVYPLCDLAIVGDEFDVMDQAFAFNGRFAETYTSLIARLNLLLTALKGQGKQEALTAQFIKPSEAECVGNPDSTILSVSFDQVAGLWVVMGAAVALGIVVTAFHHFAIKNKRLYRAMMRWRKRCFHWNRRLNHALRAARRKPDELADLGLDETGLGDSGNGSKAEAAFVCVPAAANGATPAPPSALELQQLLFELRQQQQMLQQLLQRVDRDNT